MHLLKSMLLLLTTLTATLALPITNTTTTYPITNTTDLLANREDDRYAFISAFPDDTCSRSTSNYGGNTSHWLNVIDCLPWTSAGTNWVGLSFGAGARWICGVNVFTDDKCSPEAYATHTLKGENTNVNPATDIACLSMNDNGGPWFSVQVAPCHPHESHWAPPKEE
ncbi:hypothetical protein N7G274_005318 [Stereocaulon virgatum]|uniref:Uncharacterized protein n=1 Tax=Stereocaulon virgatum TaxID=373712 RepID=A0ABR4A9K8_9LECA